MLVEIKYQRSQCFQCQAIYDRELADYTRLCPKCETRFRENCVMRDIEVLDWKKFGF